MTTTKIKGTEALLSRGKALLDIAKAAGQTKVDDASAS